MESAPADPERRRVLVKDFVDVHRPFDLVRRRIEDGESWLSPLACAAETEGEELRLRIGPDWAAGRLRREVRARLGPPRPRGDSVVVAIAWESTEMRPLFPVLDGDLELAPLGRADCRLTLYASYVPPLGEIGRGLDRALLHRLAEATARSFLTCVAAALEKSLGVQDNAAQQDAGKGDER
jgi:hypothetical protein